MPQGDRTGPMGMGPRTGRRMGFCSGYGSPGFLRGPKMGMRRGSGWGRGLRRGFGLGFGRGRFGFSASQPTWEPQPAYAAEPVQPTKEQEKQMLSEEVKAIEEEKKALAEELEAIKKRIKELQNK